MATPSVTRMVHYVSYGTPGGEYHSACRAAVVTEVDPDDPARVGLCVLNPTGVFFKSLADGGLVYAPPGTPPDPADVPGFAAPPPYPGTWHWPERVD